MPPHDVWGTGQVAEIMEGVSGRVAAGVVVGLGVVGVVVGRGVVRG